MGFENGSAIVTGGASGLGAATVRRLAQGMARVVAIDLDAERGEALAEELGDRVVFHKADVTNEEQVQAAIERATEAAPLRASVCCAGVGWAAKTVGRDGSPHTLELFTKIITINLIGTFNVARLAAAKMCSQEADEDGQRGVLVHTASVAAFDGQKGQVGYSASKAGVAGMTLPLARDLARSGIRVVTIAPGVFDTPMMQTVPENIREALAKSVPNPSRLGFPSEYADFVQRILDSPYLNAETIRLDGALRMV